MQELPVPVITMVYAGILGLMVIILSALVVRQRLRNKVGAGDGGLPALNGAIRAHGNFVEHVPLALILLLLVELGGLATIMVHALGGGLVAGRVLHAWGMSTRPGKTSFGRFWGTILTWLVILLASLILIVHFVPRL